MAARPDRSTLLTMLAVCAIALVLAFISSTLVLAKPAALPSRNNNAPASTASV